MKPEPTATPNTGATVEYQVRFAIGSKGKRRVQAAAETAAPILKAEPMSPPLVPVPPSRPVVPVAPPTRTVPLSTPEAPLPAPVSRVAKATLLLVLGHHFERLVQAGAVRDYAEIARRTGLTRARVTQIANLTLLAPEIQESILELDGSEPVTERSIRKVVAEPDWARQQAKRKRSTAQSDNRIHLCA
jgi:hypothetical protein